MKKYNFFLLALIMLLSVCSCNDEEGISDSPFIEIKVENKTLNMPIGGGEEKIKILSNQEDLHVVPQESDGYAWCNASLGITASDMYLLNINVGKNEGIGVRKADFIIKATGIENDTIHIVQLGTEPAILTNVKFKYLTKEEQDFNLEITSNVELNQVNSSDWLKLNMNHSRGEMVKTDYNYNVSANIGFSVRRDTIVISPKDKASTLEIKIPIEQEGADVDDVIPQDIKVKVKSVIKTQGNQYMQQKPENTIDGDLTTIYSSSPDKTMKSIVFEYTLSQSNDRVDYILLHTNPVSKPQNKLSKGYVSYQKEGDTKWKACGQFNAEGMSSMVRIDVNLMEVSKIKLELERSDVSPNNVSFAEFECYQIAEGCDFDFQKDKHYFEDNVFSKLKSTTTIDDIEKMTHPMVKAVAKELLGNSYSTEFRSRKYSSCKNPQIVGNELTIGKRSICDNPTGIFFKKDKKYIVFVGDELGSDELKLYIKDWREDGGNQTILLKPGLNIIDVSTDGSGYVQYWTTQDMDTPKTVNIHFCYGIELGFWDVRAKHDNDYWKKMLQKAVTIAEKENITNAMMDVCGNLVQIINTVNAFNTYCPDEITGVINNFDDLMTIEYKVMGLEKHNVVPRNRMLGVRSWGGAPNWNGTCANFPNCEENMLITEAFKKSVWLFGHEFGHGNQVQQMKGAGWAEVTNNIYSQQCMYLMNNKQCRLEHTTYKRQGYQDAIMGDRFNAYINDAVVKDKPYLTHEGELKTDDKGEYFSADPFVSLAPLWQLSLFFMFTDGAEWYKPDFWSDVIWAAIQNEENTKFDNHGQRYIDFMKRSIDAADMNLTDFFQKMGLLREIDMKVGDYGPAKQVTITRKMVDDLVNYGKSKPNPPTEVINYISGNTVDIYRQKLSMTGTFNAGISNGDKSKTISHSVWKNAVAYETYDAEGNMIEACIAGTGCTDNSSTFVRYPDGAACIKAVSWDGKRQVVCGKCK